MLIGTDAQRRTTGLRIDLSGAFTALPRDSEGDSDLIDALSFAFTEAIHARKAFWPKFLGIASLIVSIGPRCVRTHAEAADFYARWMRDVCLLESHPHVMTLPGQRVQDVLPDSDTVLIVQPLDNVESLLAHCAARAARAAEGKEKYIG